MSKVALLFFGLTRSLRFTVESIERNILNVLRQHSISYTIYLHTYDLEVLTNPRSDEQQVALNPDEYKLLKPDFVKVTKQEDFLRTIQLHDYLKHGDAWGEEGHHSSLRNLLCQLNSLKEVFTLTGDTPHDCYMLLRPDLEYVSPLDIDHVLDIVENRDQPIVYTPSWGKFGGCNDRFCIGTREAVRKIAMRIDEVADHARDHRVHSEWFLNYTLRKHGIENRDMPWLARRVRANGKKSVEDVPMPE
ncbi:hypothetical protein EBZ80_13235 [bacterium]|nr:hypothetical protein [bacterium]